MKLSILAVCLLAVTVSGVQQAAAQCTASPEDAAKALEVMAAAASAEWPLEVSRETSIESYGDFKGALVLAGSEVYQIEEILWQVTSADTLDVLTFQAYSRDGILTRIDKSGTGGKAVESLDDLSGFILGNPGGEGRTYWVEKMRFATDGDGFLTIGEIEAFDRETKAQIVLPPGTAIPPVSFPCGLRVKMSCTVGNCSGACGAAPGCPCNGTTGACSGSSESICSGSCPTGMVCNGSVQDCKCITAPPQPAGS